MSFNMILRINGILTYIESNYMFYNDIIKNNRNCNDNIIIYIYNHGFPDYSISYNESDYEIEYLNNSNFSVEHLKYKKTLNNKKDILATRFCNKIHDIYLDNCKNLSNYIQIFITFNTNGIYGNKNGDFYNKTLIKDMYDIETIVNFFCSFIYTNSKLFMIGLSTGAFLTFSYSTNFTRKSDSENNLNYFISHPNLIGIICIACVDDIPNSFNIDFNSIQINEFIKYGFCNLKINIPVNYTNHRDHQYNSHHLNHHQNSQDILISSNYLKSYTFFPSFEFLLENKRKSVNLPILLIHGTKDNNVPYNMSLNLLKLNNNYSEHELQKYMYNFNQDYFHYLLQKINHSIDHNINNNIYLKRFQQFKEFAHQNNSKFIQLHQIRDANHLITNSKHIKKAQNAISLFILEILNYQNE